MLKSMFFPMNNMYLNFGISSFSGVNNYNYADALGYGIGSGNEGAVNPARTRGLHRGVAMFTVRNTFDAADRVSATYLNNAHAEVGGTKVLNVDGSGGGEVCKIQSIYRRYHSQPELLAGSTADAGLVFQSKMQTFDDDPGVDTTKIRNLDLGFNLAHMEEIAASSMVYSDPVFNYRPNKNSIGATSTNGEYVRGNTNVLSGEDDDAHPTFKNGINNCLTSTQTIDGQPCYLGAVTDGVMRIADGELVMDIMNTEQTPCVVEIVIHSKKKNNKTKQEIFDSLYRDVDRKLLRGNPNLGNLPADSPLAGGWQALYDPTYPLLRVPSGSPTSDLISEVHRSQHVLYPGQSKEVKIALGSLWYKIKNKNDTSLDTVGQNQVIKKFKDNVGCLYVAVGHSGFEYPQTPFSIDGTGSAFTLPNTGTPGGTWQGGPYPGTGFWVGKSHSSSSVSISGKYSEKFYPLTFDRSSHNELAHTVTRPSFLTGTLIPSGEEPAVPLATIVQNRVATNQSEVIQTVAAGGPEL